MLRALLPSVASQRRLEGLRSALYPASDPCARSVFGALCPHAVLEALTRVYTGGTRVYTGGVLPVGSCSGRCHEPTISVPSSHGFRSVLGSSEGPRRTSGSCAKKHEKNDALNRVFPRMMCVLGVFHFSRLPAGLVHGTKRGVFHPLYIFLARRPKTWCFTDFDVPLHAALKHRFIP